MPYFFLGIRYMLLANKIIHKTAKEKARRLFIKQKSIF